MDGFDSQKSRQIGARDGFDRLIGLLDLDRDQAETKFQQARRRLITFFEHHGCAVAPDLADETITRVARKLEEGEEIRNVQAYWIGVARNVLKEHWGRRTREFADIDDLPSSEQPLSDPIAEDRDREAAGIKQQRFQCMRHCLQSLPIKERELIVQYCAGRDRNEINLKLRVTLNALRVKVHRIREKLRECCCDCVRRSANLKS